MAVIEKPGLRNLAAYDSDSLVARYVRPGEGGHSQVTLAIDGITCAGCIAKIESRALVQEEIQAIDINPSTHRAVVNWDSSRLSLSQLLERFVDMGYPALPYEIRAQEKKMETEHRRALIRIVVAAALGMQVMMIATGLYFGDATGMEPALRELLRYVALALTAPIMLFCAWPFFRSAVRDLRHRSIGVDVPVTIALVVAFIGSVMATIGHEGQVYYESIAMFVFLLLCARFLELTARRKGLAVLSRVGKSAPEIATLIGPDGSPQVVDVNVLKPGDRIRVAPGERIPADGTIDMGHTTVDESILTGESDPIGKQVGDRVIAGSVNLENGFSLTVSAMSHENVLSQLVHLTERAQGTKPRAATVASRISSYFVLGVLIVTAVAGTFWWFRDASMWLPVVISTLVIACPCALSLATPAAYVSAMGGLARRGIIPLRGEFLEDLEHIDHVVFDKTGTLTFGNLQLQDVRAFDGSSVEQALNFAAALNQESRHPYAAVMRERAEGPGVQANSVRHVAGAGVTGWIDDREYALGSRQLVSEFLRDDSQDIPDPGADSANGYCLLANRNGVIASFEFVDELRPEARRVVHRLRQLGCDVSLLSGDHALAVDLVATAVGIDDARAHQSPEDKLACLKALTDSGKRVAMVGDGMNDAPVMAAAQVSFAMGRAPDMTQMTADVVLVNDNLEDVIDVFGLSARTRRIIRQNFAWAIGYNLLAIPAAVVGIVPPWLAAIGMSTSSVIVSVNALRLLRQSSQIEPEPTAAKVATARELPGTG